MSKIKKEDRVKWISQSGGYTREKVGIVVGIVPIHPRRQIIYQLCDFSFLSHNWAQHSLAKLDYYLQHGDKEKHYLYSRNTVSYLVSVKIGKTNKAKRGLYRPRQVEPCEPGDERDGVYPVEKE